MKKTTTISLILLFALLSCTKTEIGPQGDKGEKGDPGTVVINSKTYHFYHIFDYNDNSFMFYPDESIGYNDVVLCYLSTASFEFEPLPIEIYYKNNNLKMSYYWDVDKITIYNDNAITNPIHYNFKAVIIKDGLRKYPNLMDKRRFDFVME